LKTSEDIAIIKAAKELWDNRLGHSDPIGPWRSPQEFWKDLGQAIAASR